MGSSMDLCLYIGIGYWVCEVPSYDSADNGEGRWKYNVQLFECHLLSWQ